MFTNYSFLKFIRNKYSHQLPIDLLLVRNGISEGAIMIKKAQKEKNSIELESLCQTHSSRWRLTDFGRLQSKSTGKWISDHFHGNFDAYMTGEYVRSIETAANLNLINAKWNPSLYLRPRDFGYFSNFKPNNLDPSEFEKLINERSRDIFYWRPPNGESIANLALRAERVLHWIRYHVPPEGKAIIVTHKDIIETFRIKLERISQMDYPNLIKNPSKKLSLNYCSILHYTRRNPKTGEVIPNYQWLRVVTPWMGKEFTPEGFQDIVSKHYGNIELLSEVSNVPHLFEYK